MGMSGKKTINIRANFDNNFTEKSRKRSFSTRISYQDNEIQWMLIINRNIAWENAILNFCFLRWNVLLQA